MVEAVLNKKICIKCNLPKDDFKVNVCKDCVREYKKNWVKRNRIKCTIKERCRIYSISVEDFNNFLEKQKNKCAICKILLDYSNRIQTPTIDHDHTCCPGRESCGKCIRGITCSRCNHGLGLFQDNPKLLAKAKKYLETWKNINEYS